MEKLQRIDDLIKALGYLKTITEKFNSDFTCYVSCHSICNSFDVNINVGGFEDINKIELRFELNMELASKNKDVLAELLDYSINGFDNNERVKNKKSEQLEEKKKLFAKLKKELLS